MHVCEYALRCWRLKLRFHLRSEFYDVHAGAFEAPRLCQVHVLGTNVRRPVGRCGGRAVVPAEAAPARLRPAWRHPRSRRRRPVRGVAFIAVKNGTVVTWGLVGAGGDSAAVCDALARDAQQVAATATVSAVARIVGYEHREHCLADARVGCGA